MAYQHHKSLLHQTHKNPVIHQKPSITWITKEKKKNKNNTNKQKKHRKKNTQKCPKDFAS